MSDTDALKLEIRKLSAQAMQAKMDLHDLSEELPIGWSQIPAVAQRAHDAFRLLESKREQLKNQAELEDCASRNPSRFGFAEAALGATDSGG